MAANINDLLAMDIHDTIKLNLSGQEVLRVPGGWIYTTHVQNGTSGFCLSSVFVPFVASKDG